MKAQFETLGYTIAGISPDPVAGLVKFRDKYDFPFPFLSDAGSALATQLGIWVEKSMYVLPYMGIDRSTFVTDPQGVVTHVFQSVKPQGHAEDVLAAVGE